MSEFSFTWGVPALEGMGYVQLFNFMLRTYTRLGVSRAEMLLLVHLASYKYNFESGESRPSEITIAEEMGYGHRSRVSDLIRSLEGKEMLLVRREPGKPSIYDASPFAKAAWSLWQETRALERTPTCAPQRTTPVRSSAHEEEEKEDEDNNIPPVGGGVVVHDLEDVAFMMEDTGQKKHELRAQCPHCGASHTQGMNLCPDCGAHVVWKGSPTWKRAHGDPGGYLRQLQGEDLKPASPLEIEACARFGRQGRFANVTQQRDVRRLARKYPDGYLRELMQWANGKGFAAFKSAAENPDNYQRWQRQQAESLPAEPAEYQPTGWELLAIQPA